ncbi:hypothetical protein BGX33_003401, partial [Mortierella sp. NVP41]
MDDEYASLATCLHDYCPLLQDLYIDSVHFDKSRNIPASLIQKISVTGFVRLAVFCASWNKGLLSAILSQAGTLEDLNIAWSAAIYNEQDGTDIFTNEQVYNGLDKSLGAKSKVNHVPRDDRRYILDVWKGQEWGYSRLERFGFELGYAGAGSIDAGFDDECDAEIATISGTNPVMGWYLHEPHAHSTSVVRSETLRLLFELLEGKEHVRTLTFEED